MKCALDYVREDAGVQALMHFEHELAETIRRVSLVRVERANALLKEYINRAKEDT